MFYRSRGGSKTRHGSDKREGLMLIRAYGNGPKAVPVYTVVTRPFSRLQRLVEAVRGREESLGDCLRGSVFEAADGNDRHAVLSAVGIVSGSGKHHQE